MTLKKTLKTFSNLKEVQLLIGTAGIYGSYLQYGLIQEMIFHTNFSSDPKAPSEKFTYSFALILFQMLLTYSLSEMVCLYKNIVFVCDFKESLKLGSYNFISMFGSNSALKMVSYPLQALTKSCKILSILLVGLVFGGIKFTRQQVACGILITAGIFMFNYSESGKQDDKSSSWLGLACLLVSLFFDGMLGSEQSKLKEHKRIGQWEMMRHIGMWGFIISLAYAILSQEIFGFLEFITQYPSIIKHLLVLSTLGVIGQVFIFYCISNFSPRVLSIITTTRKFFTVLFSIFIYGHHVSQIQWVAISIIAAGVSWELLNGLKHGKKPK